MICSFTAFALGVQYMLKRTMERLERIETRLQMKHDYLPSLPDVSNDSFSEVYNGTEMESPNLINPEEVIRKYRSFVVPSKLPKLSVKLAREAFIGDNIMTKSTVQGQGSRGLQALPPDKLGKVQSVIKELVVLDFSPKKLILKNAGSHASTP